jgi:hypothetical protein
MKYRLVTGVGLILALLGFVVSGEAAHFRCTGGDAACLIEAINRANANGRRNTIALGPGVYRLTLIDNPGSGSGANGLPVITGRMIIQGTDAQTTIIERDASAPEFRIFQVAASGNLSLIRVTVAGGGGASVVAGGGILAEGVLSIVRGIVTGNQARDGGGIESLGTTRIVNSSVVENAASVLGGGLHATGSDDVIEDSTFARNSALFGGALNAVGATVLVTSSTISDNRAFGGGAIVDGIPDAPPSAVPPSTIRVSHSTVVGNQASVASGGIVVQRGTVSLQATIVAFNTASPGPADCEAGVTSLGFNLIADPTECPIVLLDSDVTGDPLLGDFVEDGTPGEGYFPLLAGSPAIDADGERRGHRDSSGDCPRTDQIGQRRVGACDIGAIEFQPVRGHEGSQ